MPPSTIPEPWLSFLRELDQAAHEPVHLNCLGGFVVTTLYGFDRPTADFDVLEIAPRAEAAILRSMGAEGGPLHRKYGVYLDYVTVAAVPYEYESRLKEMFPESFEHLHLMALDPYDLALSKLERNIQRDRDDVKHLAHTIPFKIELLQQRYETELRPLLGNKEREDLTLKLWIDMIEEDRRYPAVSTGDAV